MLDYSYIWNNQPDEKACYSLPRRAVLMFLAIYDRLTWRSSWPDVTDQEFDDIQATVAAAVSALSGDSAECVDPNEVAMKYAFFTSASNSQELLDMEIWQPDYQVIDDQNGWINTQTSRIEPGEQGLYRLTVTQLYPSWSWPYTEPYRAAFQPVGWGGSASEQTQLCYSTGDYVTFSYVKDLSVNSSAYFSLLVEPGHASFPTVTSRFLSGVNNSMYLVEQLSSS